jgi:hypothetical protein
MPAPRSATKRWVIIAFCGLTAVISILWLIFSEHSPLAFVIGLRHAINQRERGLLYDTDHAVLAQIMREFATDRQWASGQPTKSEFGPPEFGPLIAFGASDQSLPPALRVLKPSRIIIFDDRIELEFGGAFLHFGIRAFRPGLPGNGTKRLGEGVWFYSEDGYVPSR